MAMDLVCGMIVDENSAPAETRYDGKDYYFCADFCRQAFDTEPERYVGEAKEWGEAVDPVCGMTVKIPQAAAMSVHKDEFIYFCSVACKEKFDAAPEQVLRAIKDTEEGVGHGSPSPLEGLKSVDLPITGMSCASCVAKIEKGLKKLKGVSDAKISPRRGPRSHSNLPALGWEILSPLSGI